MNLSDIRQAYDIVVAGGGITGAGVFHEAVKKGYRVLLVEAEDFAWGTSSRSSKMVHGGLRYLKQGRFLMTRAAVLERERLLKAYPGLVIPQQYILPVFSDYGPGAAAMRIGLSIYSLMANCRQHTHHTRAQTLGMVPGLRSDTLVSAVGFKDAQVDDARLVLRLIFDTCRMGGTALNYTRVTGVSRDRKAHVAAVHILDRASGKTVEVKTRGLVNATGAAAETLHPSPVKSLHIRPLRGSHLFFPGHLYPMDRVISFIHPRDLRPVFLFPWEGVLALGTTDVDHDGKTGTEPFVSSEEAAYLMDGLAHVLPGCGLQLNHCISSIAGVRPVLSRKKTAASRESREHVVWVDKGLVTVTGGKLTTFRILANDALSKITHPPSNPRVQETDAIRQADDSGQLLAKSAWDRLTGRYGALARQMVTQADERQFSPVENTSTLWAEIGHALTHEQVHHLSDLMLRRVRIGLLLPRGGQDLLDKIESLCRTHLSWDSPRWEAEKQTYIHLWQKHYAPPHP